MGNDIYFLFAVGGSIAAYVAISWFSYNRKCAASRKKYQAANDIFKNNLGIGA